MKHQRTQVPVAGLTAEVAALFEAAGLAPAAAREMAGALVDAEREGLAAHGLMHAGVYLQRLRAGSISTADAAEVVSSRGAVAVLDAHHMLGHLAARQAMALAIARAHAFGIGAVAVRGGAHFGAAGRYAAQAAQHGCIGLALANTRPMMPAPGGAEALVGNNPIAIAVPAAHEPPLVMDLATSEGSLAKIRVAARSGAAIPSTWAVTADGRPTTDATEALGGLLLPIGGAKGFALSLAVDLLCGLLSGGALGGSVRPLYGDVTQPNDCAFLLIAIDIASFGVAADVRARAEQVRQRIETSRRAGDDPVVAPGRRRWETARRQADTVEVDTAVLEALRALRA